MKTTVKLVGLTLLVLALLAMPAFADHHEGEHEGHGKMDMEAMMAAMQKNAKPGACHKKLGTAVGSFDIKTTMYPEAGAPPVESTGTSEGEWILGERFVETTYKGEMMGMAFEGHGLDGYDNQTEKYTGVWVDTMGTYTMISKGECDLESDSVIMTGSMMDPMGKTVKSRMVTTPTEAGYTMESYVVTDEGDFKNFELIATRK